MITHEDHSRRIATVLMSVARIATSQTVGLPALLDGQLLTALTFNAGRHPETGFGGEGRSVAQEDLQFKAGMIGVRRALSGAHDRCDFTNEQHWILDALPSKAQRSREEGFRHWVAGHPARAAAGLPPVLTGLLELIALTNRLWVYIGLLLARVGPDECGWFGTLADWALLPSAAGGNRQGEFSKARRALSLIDAELRAADEGPRGDALGTLLGRLESRFGQSAAADPLELATFLASVWPARPSALYPLAWEALAPLAGYGPAERAGLVAALRVYRDLIVRPKSPAGPLGVWLAGLTPKPAGQHPPAVVLSALSGIDPGEPPEPKPKGRPAEQDRLYQRLMRRLSANTWRRSLFGQIRKDCRPAALIGWAKDQVPTPGSLAERAGLRRAVSRRLKTWREFAAAGGHGPDSSRLLFLEMPDGQHTNAGAMAEGRALLRAPPPTWAGVSRSVQEVVYGAVVSVRLDRLCERVRALRKKRGATPKGGTR